MAALTNRAERAMDHRIASFLRQELPDRTKHIEQPRLTAWFARMRGRAATYGVITEQGLMKWMLLGIFLGQEFDELPAIRSLLEGDFPDIDGDQRLGLLIHEIGAQTAWS